MPDPTKFTPGYDYSDFQTGQPNKPKPGDKLDIDFANIALSIDQTVEALKDIRRSDGKLKNGIVTVEAMEPGLGADIFDAATETAENAAKAKASEDSAALSSATAGANSGRLEVATFAQLATTFGYSSAGGRRAVAAGDLTRVVDVDATYVVASSGASDAHLDYTSSGGVKLYVRQGATGLDIRATGAVLDNVTDDSAAINRAANAARALGCGLSAPDGRTTYIANAIDLTGLEVINFGADIRVNPAIVGVPVTVGGRANVIGGRWQFGDVSDGTSVISGAPPSRPVFRIFGSKAVNIVLGNCQYVQFWADGAVSSGSSNAYNIMTARGAWYKFEFAGAAGVSWNNENFIYAGRIKKLIFDGTSYPHNHNKIFHPTMEGSDVDIQFIGAVSANQIYGARFEGATGSAGVTFSATSYSNTITWTWSGTGNPRNQFAQPLPIVDNGMGNLVTSEAAFMFRKVPIFEVGPSSNILSTATDTSAPDPRIAPSNAGVNNLTSRATIAPGLAGFSADQTFRWVALSDPIPVQLGDVVVWDADYVGNLVRTFIFALDADMKPLTNNAGGEFISQASTSFTSAYGQYSQSANVAAASLRGAPAAVVRSEVKYIRVGFVQGVLGPIRYLGASLYTQALGRGASEGARRSDSIRSLNGTPTRGYVAEKTLVWDSTASAMRRCTLQYETTLNGALAAGATSVTVTAPSTIANGDICGILLDDGSTHWSAISGLSGSAFTITAVPAGRSAPTGGRIVFNRWA